MPRIIKTTMIDSKLCSKIFHFNKIRSTNELAREYITKRQLIGFVITTISQSSGKGQKERIWESPPGGFWGSLAIKPELDSHLIGLTPLLTAVATVETLKLWNIEVMLKWPNDILMKSNKKKLGGILVEGKVLQSSLEYLILGIGININNTITQYSNPLRNKITTIYEEYKIRIDLNILLEKLIYQIEKYFGILQKDGADPIRNAWKTVDNILGMDVTVRTPEKEYYGKAIDISKDGHLIIETFNLERKVITTGTLSFKI